MEQLAAIVSDVPDYCLLVISSKKMDKRTKLYKQLKASALICPCERIKERDLDDWLYAQAAVYGAHFTRDALAAISEYIEPVKEEIPLDLLQQEIGKLAIYAAERREWTEEDDGWYFFMRQNLQGLPVYSQYVYLDNTDIDTPLRFLCSRRGVEEMHIDYYFDFQEGEERTYLLPFEKIAEVVAERNNELLTESEYEVSKAVLCQFVPQKDKDYKVTPAWIIDVIETNEEGVYPFTMIVNAVTGEEIIQ